MFLARKDDNSFYIVYSKDFLAFGVVLVRHLTAVTAAVRACSFVHPPICPNCELNALV